MNDQPDELEALKQENAELRELLAHSQLGADLYRKAAYDMFRELDTEPPLSDEEIHELMTAPRDRPLLELIEEYERELGG